MASQKQKQKRRLEWIEGWDDSKFLLLDPLEWPGFHFVVLDGQISKFSLDAAHKPSAGPTQSFKVVLEKGNRFRLTLRPDICPEFSLDGVFTVTQEPQESPQRVERGIIVAKSASGSLLPIQLLLQGTENIVCNPSEPKRQYPVEATVRTSAGSGTMSSANDTEVKYGTLVETRGLKGHRHNPSRFKQDDFVEREFGSKFPHGFRLFEQGGERVVIFESLASVLGAQNPFTSQGHFDTSWWEEVVNYDGSEFSKLSDGDEQRTHVRKCQYIVSCATAKLGHEVLIGVCYDDGTKGLLSPPCRQEPIVWVHVKLPTDKNSFKLRWSRMQPEKSGGAVFPIA